MRIPTLLAYSFIYTALFTSNGLAVNICDFVYLYMDKGPDQFMAERGDKIDDDTWNAPTGLPNSKCEIRINSSSDVKIYNYDCTVNRGQSWGSVATFRTKIFDELEICLKSKNIGWNKRKDVMDRNGKSVFINSWEVSAKDRKSAFRIDLRATKDNSGSDNYATFGLQYTDRM